MSTAAVIRFPPPPPTRNELSSQQRAKLIRTNNKLGQVLGSTPHVLDLTYVVPTEPKARKDTPTIPTTPTPSRNPFRTHARKKSTPKIDMDKIRVITQSPDSLASSTSNASSRSSARSLRVKTDELAWRSPYPAQRPPLLKLSVPNQTPSSRRPKLETIPGSPPFDQLTTPVNPPTFCVPSEAAMRREKMRRVRKMLGDGVPADLVFPHCGESSSDSEEDSPLISTPTSVLSREWLLVDTNKPLPKAPSGGPQIERARAATPPPGAKKGKTFRNRLFKEQQPTAPRPSKATKRLESIAESAKETRAESLTCLGVSASAGVDGRGRSRRFIEGKVAFDQIGTAWGGAVCHD